MNDGTLTIRGNCTHKLNDIKFMNKDGDIALYEVIIVVKGEHVTNTVTLKNAILRSLNGDKMQLDFERAE